MHNIQAYFGKLSLIDVSKMSTLSEIFKVKVKVIFGAAFHKQKIIWTKFEVSVTIWEEHHRKREARENLAPRRRKKIK